MFPPQWPGLIFWHLVGSVVIAESSRFASVARQYQNDHENANGQFKMNWEFDDVLATA